MRYSIKETVAPASEPITLAEARLHLKLDANNDSPPTHPDDDLVSALITAAREHVEEWLGIALVKRTIKEQFDDFPSGGENIVLHRYPVQSVTSITYTDTDGNAQTWASSNYSVDVNGHPPVVYEAYNKNYPATRDIRNAVTVTYVAGFDDSGDSPQIHGGVPKDIVAAMKLIIGDLYEHREAAGTFVTRVYANPAVDALLAKYRYHQW